MWAVDEELTINELGPNLDAIPLVEKLKIGVYTCQLLTFQCLGQEMVQKKSPIGESIREKDKLALHQNCNKTPQLMSCTCACVHSAQLSVVENSARFVCTAAQYSQSGPCLRVC